jgi:two-component system, OmpR family, copper resistance phosphate regulon response regulator CusR
VTRILIAEDEERIVAFLEKGLEASGYTTMAVSSGTEALALARDGMFDLVILDLGLRDLDGQAVLRSIRNRGDARCRCDNGQSEPSVLTAGSITLDLRSRRASIDDGDVPRRSIELTAREFALAETFLRHAGQVLTREQLLSHVWGYHFDPGSNVVGGVHPLPAPQARSRHDRDGARDGLPAAHLKWRGPWCPVADPDTTARSRFVGGN